jgi:hypothetical protein
MRYYSVRDEVPVKCLETYRLLDNLSTLNTSRLEARCGPVYMVSKANSESFGMSAIEYRTRRARGTC